MHLEYLLFPVFLVFFWTILQAVHCCAQKFEAAFESLWSNELQVRI